jgi:DNA-binding protein WhiA
VSAKLAPPTRPPRRVVSRSCCRRAYLRGALLAAGSLSGPRSPHLEIRSSGVAGAGFVAGVARADGLRLAVLERERHAVAYAKGSDGISDLLLAAGAQELALTFQERAVVGATRSRANRLANADHANLVRTSRAAQQQVRAVRRLARSGRLTRLPTPLRELANLRLAHPSATVRELASRCEPAVSKAAAHRRLQRLVGLARQ